MVGGAVQVETEFAEDEERQLARETAAQDRDRHADQRDAAAVIRDAQGAERERAEDRADDAGARGTATRGAYRSATRADRAAAADDRAAAARDGAASADDRRHAQQRIDALSHDALTGFYQRGAGLIELARDYARGERTGEPFTVAFVDIDGLKRLNDTAGHAAGDEGIHRVATVIRSVLRGYDVLVRYGGDEFLCGTLGLEEAVARDRWTRLQAALDDAGGSTVSFGVVQRRGEESLDDVIRRADDAMYAQKRQRRER